VILLTSRIWLAYLILLLLGCTCFALANPISEDVQNNQELRDAYGIYQRAKMEDLQLTTDPYELGESVSFSMIKKLIAEERYQDLFDIGDEAFEKETDQRFGKGVGTLASDGSSPTRLLMGIGGMDSSSCRSCHFKGGPDGSGTLSSIAMLRSDGVHASTATLRDSPHVMGLGYIQLIAEEITQDLKFIAKHARQYALHSGKSLTANLTSKGISYGKITAKPDGLFDTSKVKHIANDLIVRPFGHKGRARNLFEFVDEALQVHHGIQTDSRLQRLSKNKKLIGSGPKWDPDEDGYQGEASAARSMVLASYLSLLGVPSIKPPKSSSLIMAWGEGQRLFKEVGCASCHIPKLNISKDVIEHKINGSNDASIKISLLEHGQSPKPMLTDLSPDINNFMPVGTPIYAFTDLRLHDLGDHLADQHDEPTIDGSGVIDKSLWLTRSLWGLADTGPYLHDGRAASVEEAIRLHGGEALAVSNKFKALEPRQQKAILVFLASLTREPTVLIE